eukprot:394016_1
MSSVITASLKILIFTYLPFLISGQYLTSTFAITIFNPSYPNHQIPLLVHYPITNESTKFPLIVFNHGGDCKNTWYNYVWKNLVPQGYIVAMPNDYHHLLPNDIEEYAAGQRYTNDYLRIQSETNSSFILYSKISNRSMASGHSMGGGASFLSLGNYPVSKQTFKYKFNAAFTLSGCGLPWQRSLLEQSLMNLTQADYIFVMSGTHDCICPPPKDGNAYYNAVPIESCKILGDILNGTHCGFEQASLIGTDECWDAELLECVTKELHDHRYSITSEEQYTFVKRYMTLFAKAALYDYNNNSNVIQQIKDSLVNDYNSGMMGEWDVNC